MSLLKLPMRIWFNRPFALAYRVLSLIREADAARQFTLICTHKQAFFTGYAAADEWQVEPADLDLDADAYRDWCLDFAVRQKIDVIVPGHETAALVRAGDMFAAHGIRLLAPAHAETLPKLHDKSWVYGQLADQHFLASSVDLHHPGQLAEAVESIWAQGHRACIKPTVSVYGKGFYRLMHPDDTRRPLRGLSLDEWMRKSVAEDGTCAAQQVLEYLPGHEFSVDCVADQGHWVAGVVRKKAILSNTQLLDDNPLLLRYAQCLIERFGLNGMINVQFKEDAQGMPRLLEINPRASGGIAMSCLSGINLPYLALRGFVDGYAGLAIPPARLGQRVTEIGVAISLPTDHAG
ncbi:ATP-grasp domain-containing protein [Variovorax sp. J22R133]|uniref:ATP-grasp domain-containing protein n=1 Tax=Variovorax brevis TaxID=3053503 RepID=UPI0025752E80|nr:ATP-grasp domain-containing protein [Variovorax sp. J22R133]MDM0115184.1 ATP-grasp domain-containing protein [Variovorax sp. J22R133]